MKHTPAPWKHHNYTIYHGGLKVARIPNLRAVGKRQASDHEEEQANARLIAAAPELLEALREIVKAHDINMGKSAVQLRIDLAREAIAKATA